jgi:hypothetical protein
VFENKMIALFFIFRKPLSAMWGGLTVFIAVALMMESGRCERGRVAGPTEERVDLEEEPPLAQLDRVCANHGRQKVGEGEKEPPNG